jgi:hypothetical protein
MNTRTLLLLSVLALLLTACEAAPSALASTPAGPPFPTMTLGRVVRGPLPPAAPPPAQGALANPATAIALANLPTPTPNLTTCPAPVDDVSVAQFVQGGTPRTSAEISDAIERSLSAGGTVGDLEQVLRNDWAVLEGGFVRGDLDLTGEGTPEVIVSLRAPDAGGLLLIYGCIDGRFSERYQGILSADGSARAPQILSAVDFTANGLPDLFFSAALCAADETCDSINQIVTWDGTRGRFNNLLGAGLASAVPLVPQDIDNDRISELVVRLTDDGSARTGPLRTGQIVYDWDGAQYVRSYTEYDPPRFRIQMVFDADAAFAQGRTRDAITLYDLAVSSPNLENWQNDDITVLPAYARFRLMLAYADLEDPRLIETHAQILQLYPDLATAPVYAEMAIRFWDALQTTSNLNSACAAALEVAGQRQEAVGLLNRYGSESPVYTPADLCPF